MGQEKSPFQRYELTSSNTLPSIERGVVISGLRIQQEAMNNLVVANGYGSHDLGAFLDYATPNTRFAIKAGVQGGSRESTRDVNNAKSYYARATGTVLVNAEDQPVLQVGASFAARDRAICNPVLSSCTSSATTPSRSTPTLEDDDRVRLDFELGGFRPGLHVIGDFAGRQRPGRAAGERRCSTPATCSTAPTRTSSLRPVHVVGAYRI
jgi:hypothetical protein